MSLQNYLPAKLYLHSDSNAPQGAKAANNFSTILKACLVTGYGSKTAAGWEIAWEDAVANKIALRSKNPTSIKSVLLVNDNAAASSTVTAYGDWNSATNAGTGQFATGYFVKQWNSGFTPNWVVIATDKFFYLFIQSESQSQAMRVMSGFGDAISLRNDKFFSVCLCQPAISYSDSATGYSTVPTQTGRIASFPPSLFQKNSISTKWGDRGLDNDINYSSTVILSQFALYVDIDASSAAGTKAQPIVQLPGMLMPYSPLFVSITSNNINMITNQPPYKNRIFGMYQPWHGRVWIHTDDWGQ